MQAGGLEAWIERLKDPATRARSPARSPPAPGVSGVPGVPGGGAGGAGVAIIPEGNCVDSMN